MSRLRSVQRRNEEMAGILGSDFRKLYNPVHALADSITMLQMFPGVVGIWPGAATGGGSGNKTDMTDVSGNGLHLTRSASGGTLVDVGLSLGFQSHMFFNPSGPGYFSHADSTIFDVTGTESHIAAGIRGLSLGGWYRVNALPSVAGNSYGLLSKWNVTGNNRSYLLYANQAADRVDFALSSAGSALDNNAVGGAIPLQEWFFAAGTYNAQNQEMTVYVGTEENGLNVNTDTTGVPASIFSGTAGFYIGAWNGGASNTAFDGRGALFFLCQARVLEAHIEAFFEMSRPLFNV